MAYLVITGCLSVEVGQTVFPKLHVFLLFLFIARLSCSGRLTGSQQSSPP